MRITNHSATIIDNIFVNCYHDIIDPTIVISDFSDQFPLVLWLKILMMYSNRKHQKHAIINALIEQKNNFLLGLSKQTGRKTIQLLVKGILSLPTTDLLKII